MKIASRKKLVYFMNLRSYLLTRLNDLLY